MGASRSMTEATVGLEQQLEQALGSWVEHSDEADLDRAHDIGRTALAQDWSIPHLVAIHGRALRAVLGRMGVPIDDEHLRRGEAFLAGALSCYEMTHRGYRDAIAASRQLNDALEQAARRIARALHDEAGQVLVSVHLAVANFGRALLPEHQAGISEIQGLLAQVEQQLRRLSHELRPTVLDDLGWLPAIQFLAEGVSQRAQIEVHVRSDVGGRPSPQVETALYRTVQEALTNAARHSQASRVDIEVERDGGMLRCLISDDGVGFEPGTGRAGLGLLGMRERADAVGGRLSVVSQPGTGTRITLWLPLGE